MKPTTEQVFGADVDKHLLCLQVDKAATNAIEALYALRAYLWAWRDYPKLVGDDAFASIILDLGEAGLEEFIDRQPFDELRSLITGISA